MIVQDVTISHARNRDLAENFKTALCEERVHQPSHSLDRDELLYLEAAGDRSITPQPVVPRKLKHRSGLGEFSTDPTRAGWVEDAVEDRRPGMLSATG